MISRTGFIICVAVITLGIIDLCLITFRGDGSSISNFMITIGFKDPVVVFTFGFVAGHFFGYETPVPLK